MDLVRRLRAVRQKQERLALGLMSGMSRDGVDLALVRLVGRGERPAVRLLAGRTVAYDADLSRRLRSAIGGSVRDVTLLSSDLAERWAAEALRFLADARVRPEEVDLLGSHGQTLDHVPRSPGKPASTLQVGSGDVLAERTGILTVWDFRTRDVAAGGEGAPLVPVADWVLYARRRAVVACLNLGSIANVTVVPPRLADLRAFDAGPANALIDGFARIVPGNEGDFDRDGKVSAAGEVSAALLAYLRGESAGFLARPPPRSAGYDDFGPPLVERAAAAFAGLPPADRVRTAVEFTALTLAEAFGAHVLPAHPRLRRVLVTGGGARNPTLLGRIREALGAGRLEVEVPSEAWVDGKEAVAFAILADRTVRGLPGNAPGATGATRPVVLGRISV